MILYAKTLKRCFWDQIPWKTCLRYGIISILTFPKNNPTKFWFRCHRLIFISYTYVHIYMKHKFIDSRQYRNVTNYMNIANAYINWLYRCFTYLGGSFIELTIHEFFILNIAKFKFEKMSRMDLFFSLDITLDKEISWHKLIILWALNRQEKLFLRKSLGLFL